MKLRAYQDQAVDALLKDAYDGLCPVGVLPTGAGKTVVMRAIIERWLLDHPDHQILLLAHRTRLLTQARHRFEGIPTLVVSAGMGMWDEAVPGSVTVASIQTISRLKDRRDWDLVLVDEAHRVGTEEEGGQYVAYLQSLDKDPPIIGLTATPWRMVDNRHVPIYGAQSLFQKAACWIYPEDLIAQNYLLAPEVVPVRYILPTTGIQLPHGEVAVTGIHGYRSLDFTQRIQELLEKTKDCNHVLIFCDTIKEAEAVAEALAGCQPLAGCEPLAGCKSTAEDQDFAEDPSLTDAHPLAGVQLPAGVQPLAGASCVLHGGHSENERNEQIERFRMGAFRYLVNVDVFTEGLDVPEIDAVVLLRRTQSVVRYLQMAGRGLRPHEQGKTTCRILDYGQHIERLGPLEAARGEDALPLAWKKRRWRNRDTETSPGSIFEPDEGREVPACTEPEAALCVPLKAWKALPIRARNGMDFLLLRFQIDDPDPSSNKTLWMERKLHASDPSLREMARRWSRLSGIPLAGRQPLAGAQPLAECEPLAGRQLSAGAQPLAGVQPLKKPCGTKREEVSLPQRMMSMLGSGQGFLDYAPFAIRVRWSDRTERWMVDGWQWSGRAHMRMNVGDERALNTWIQRTMGTQDAVEQAMRQFLYRLSRSGVLDLQDDQPGAALQAAGLQAAALQATTLPSAGQPIKDMPSAEPSTSARPVNRHEKTLKEQESATVGGVYNKNIPHEHPQSPAKGWDTPSSPFESPGDSPSVRSAVFPPSRPPAWLLQQSVAPPQGIAPSQGDALPQGDTPLQGVVPLSSGGDLPSAVSLEDFEDVSEEERLWVPQGVS